MTTIEHGQAPEAPVVGTDDLDAHFDLDVRIAVGEGMTLPEAGFTCSWYTCGGGNPATFQSWHACC